MRTSTFTAWDRALGGQLAAMLADYRAEGLSMEDIAYRLRSEHAVQVTKSTVARWVALTETEAAS